MRASNFFQHVDDMSNLAVASTSRELIRSVTKYATEFKEWTDRLQLEISPKTVAIPNNELTKQVCRSLHRRGVPIKAVSAGVDIGVYTSAAMKRVAAKQ